MGQHDLNKIQKLLPNENCSMCAAPSCSTLARRIVAGKISPEQCPIIDKANISRLKEILAEGVETQKAVTLEKPFVEIQPCAEYGRVTLEAQLPKPKGSVYDLFDSCTMCTAFSDISELDGVKCSLELGYGLAQLEEKRIHVFRSGKVTMRRAYDRRDAYETLQMISWSLWPSVICSCGCTVQECMSCACPDCRDQVCPGLAWGVRDLQWKEQGLGEFVREIMEKDDEVSLKAVSRFKEGMDIIGKIVGHLEDTDRSLRSGELDKVEDIRKQYHDTHMELSKLSVKMLVDTAGPARLLGLILNGAEDNLKNLGKGLFSIRTPQKHDLYDKGFEMGIKGVRIFMDMDIDAATAMVEECRAFREEWMAKPYSTSREYVLKIGTYGCYMANMVLRRVPVWTIEDERNAGPTPMVEGESCD